MFKHISDYTKKYENCVLPRAHSIRNALEAGLLLSGREDERLEWIGTNEKWRKYQELESWFYEFGSYKV